jgi:hypothetical protein
MSDGQDWRRLRGQEDYLTGTKLLWKPYRARSATEEHDHCEFCNLKFMDPTFSPEHARAIANDPQTLTEGYAVQGGMTLSGPQDDYWWVCEQCAKDFAVEFKWTLLHVV